MPKIHLIIASNKDSQSAVSLWRKQALSWCEQSGVDVLSLQICPNFDDIETLRTAPNTWLICDGNDGREGVDHNIRGLSPRIASFSTTKNIRAAILLTSTGSTLEQIKRDVSLLPKLAGKAFCHISCDLFAGLNAVVPQRPKLPPLDLSQLKGTLLATVEKADPSPKSPPSSPIPTT